MFGVDAREVRGTHFTDLTLKSAEESGRPVRQRILNLEDRFKSEGTDLRTPGGALQRIDINAELIHVDDLDLAVVAKGVETDEQARILAQMGCYRFQGHLYGKPMDREASRRHAGKAVDRAALQPAG